ncbi:DUF1236 domain-containing protein [Neorhizobium alkalisoli]|uniref:DUF1236 domain-containing protein n=1 Tax=Neorhizobium alkalisoli TaxID=528178 RepID=UPI000CF9869B|nr:DUF1236 domain-containing protein [Neorhizobium alkalisoli]
MKKIMISAVTGLALTAGAFAAAAQTVVIAPEQETVIKEYVTKQKVKSIDVPNVTVSIGTALPETVELHTVDVPDVKYRYAVVGGKTVLVEPGTRKIVHVIN